MLLGSEVASDTGNAQTDPFKSSWLLRAHNTKPTRVNQTKLCQSKSYRVLFTVTLWPSVQKGSQQPGPAQADLSGHLLPELCQRAPRTRISCSNCLCSMDHNAGCTVKSLWGKLETVHIKQLLFISRVLVLWVNSL